MSTCNAIPSTWVPHVRLVGPSRAPPVSDCKFSNGRHVLRLRREKEAKNRDPAPSCHPAAAALLPPLLQLHSTSRVSHLPPSFLERESNETPRERERRASGAGGGGDGTRGAGEELPHLHGRPTRVAAAPGPSRRHAVAAAAARPGNSNTPLLLPPRVAASSFPRCVPLLIDHRARIASVARSRRRLSGRWCSGVRSPRRRPTASPRGQIASHSQSPLPPLLSRDGPSIQVKRFVRLSPLMAAPPGSRAPRPSGRR